MGARRPKFCRHGLNCANNCSLACARVMKKMRSGRGAECNTLILLKNLALLKFARNHLFA
jgi:hypothetical protein